MYKVEHTGERIVKGGRVEKVGPRAMTDKTGKWVTIKPGEVKDLDLSEDMARIIINLDGGPLKFHLTDEQAEKLNMPVKREKPVKMLHGNITENWKDLPWNERRALAVSLANGVPVTSGKLADKIISDAIKQRDESFRLARRERKNPDGLRSAHR